LDNGTPLLSGLSSTTFLGLPSYAHHTVAKPPVAVVTFMINKRHIPKMAPKGARVDHVPLGVKKENVSLGYSNKLGCITLDGLIQFDLKNVHIRISLNFNVL
jgi:hypothetical protein